MRATLAGVEIALAVVLVTAAGLLIRSFSTLLSVNPGYDPVGVVTARISVPQPDYGTRWFQLRAEERAAHIEADIALFDRMLERATALPNVRAAGMTSLLPLQDGDFSSVFALDGHPKPSDPSNRPRARLRLISPDYPRTMGMRLVGGRFLSDRDRTGGAKVVLVNEAFVRRYLSDSAALGQRLRFGDEEPPWEIVGIVGDVRHAGPAVSVEPIVYRSYRQEPDRGYAAEYPHVALRVDGDPLAVVRPLQAVLTEIHPDAVIDDVMTMEARLSASIAEPRLHAILLGGYGLTALGLAVVGIYGVLAYTVSRQRREVGVRLALGAQRRDILNHVLRQGAMIAGVGVASGLVGAVVAARFLESLLFGVTATDPVTFVAVPLLLLTVAALACALPARRAAHVDPMDVLRAE